MNKHRGEFLLKLGKDEYKVCYSINALCSLEEITKKTVIEIGEILSHPEKLSLNFARAFLWAGLQKYHPMTTIEGAGDLLEEHGMEMVVTKLVEGFATAFPQSNNSDRPMMEGNQSGGNGKDSSSIGSNVV